MRRTLSCLVILGNVPSVPGFPQEREAKLGTGQLHRCARLRFWTLSLSLVSSEKSAERKTRAGTAQDCRTLPSSARTWFEVKDQPPRSALAALVPRAEPAVSAEADIRCDASTTT